MAVSYIGQEIKVEEGRSMHGRAKTVFEASRGSKVAARQGSEIQSSDILCALFHAYFVESEPNVLISGSATGCYLPKGGDE